MAQNNLKLNVQFLKKGSKTLIYKDFFVSEKRLLLREFKKKK